jgi:phosphate-selective porin OprO/OprP
MAEYVSSKQAVTRATNHRNIANHGWEVTAGYVLTGEERTYNGVVPEHAAWRGGLGAFELVARSSRLKLDTDAFIGTAALRLADPTVSAYEVTDYGVGLNWYLTRLVRINFNYDKNTFKGLAGFSRPEEHVFIGRFQVAF